MKRLLITLALALISTTANAAPGGWRIESKTSALDNSTDYEASIQSDEQLTNILGQPERATLAVVCSRSGFDLQLLWPDFVQKDDIQDLNVTVSWKLDAGGVQRGDWIAITKAVGQLGDRGLSTLKIWSSGAKLVVRVPDQHGGQDATFELAGIDQVYAHVSQTNCG